MSHICMQHSWSHAQNACPFCSEYAGVSQWQYDQVCRERDEAQKLVDTYFQEQLELHDEVTSLQKYKDWALEAWETLDSYVHCHLKPDEIEDEARELLAKFPGGAK